MHGILFTDKVLQVYRTTNTFDLRSHSGFLNILRELYNFVSLMKQEDEDEALVAQVANLQDIKRFIKENDILSFKLA